MTQEKWGKGSFARRKRGEEKKKEITKVDRFLLGRDLEFNEVCLVNRDKTFFSFISWLLRARAFLLSILPWKDKDLLGEKNKVKLEKVGFYFYIKLYLHTQISF